MRTVVAILIIFTTGTLYSQETALFDFAKQESVQPWFPVDDVVMGGISSSQMQYSGEGVAQFSGELSLENNGGFASVRFADKRFNLSNFEGVELRVKGDNKTYQFRFQTDIARISYAQPFLAPDEWTTVKLPFKDFEAIFFGRKVIDAPELNTSDLRTVVFMLTDKQEGDFKMLVDWVKVY